MIRTMFAISKSLRQFRVPAVSAAWLAAACVLQSACAAGSSAPNGTAMAETLQLIVKPVATLDESALAREVSASAGVPESSVAVISDSGGGWRAVQVRCPIAGKCQVVLERLRADRSRFSAVELDARKSTMPGSRGR